MLLEGRTTFSSASCVERYTPSTDLEASDRKSGQSLKATLETSLILMGLFTERWSSRTRAPYIHGDRRPRQVKLLLSHLSEGSDFVYVCLNCSGNSAVVLFIETNIELFVLCQKHYGNVLHVQCFSRTSFLCSVICLNCPLFAICTQLSYLLSASFVHG